VSAREAIAIYEKVTGYKLVQEKKEEEEEMGSHGSGHDDQHTQSEKHQPQTSSVGHSTPPTTEHAQSKPIFLDLRSSEDVKQFWIDGFLSVPFNKLKDHIKEDKLSKNVPIYLIDLSGYKSEKAADILAEAGFQHIHVIEGLSLSFSLSLHFIGI
jgi:rhodanese-related sulfurtransferase